MATTIPLVGGITPPHARSYTTFVADRNLLTVSGCPDHPAQRIEVHNDATSTQDIVLTGFDGTNFTVEVPADSVRFIDCAVKAIVAIGTETISSVVVYWWSGGASRLNP